MSERVDLTLFRALERHVGPGRWFDIRRDLPTDPSARYRFPSQTIADNTGLALHHSTGDARRVTPGGVASWHIHGRNWEGIGYHFWIAWDGSVYYVGDLETSRAHVADLNDFLVGICFAGDWRRTDPPRRMLEAAGRLALALDEVHGRTLPAKGHRTWSPTTECPGRIADLAPGVRDYATAVDGPPFDVEAFVRKTQTIRLHPEAAILRAILADGFVPVGSEDRPDDAQAWVAQAAEHPVTREVRAYAWRDGAVSRFVVRRPTR